MAKVKVQMNSAGARTLLQSAAVQKDLLSRAQRIRDGAKLPGYVADVQAGKNRARAVVKATDFKSRQDNARNQTLLKNLDRGR